MAFLSVGNSIIRGISAAVPRATESVAGLSIFSNEEAQKFTEATGVVCRHISDRLVSSDLCCAAAEKIIADLGWEKSTIDGLVVVTQCPDYIKPANSTIVQHRLGLSKECVAVSLTFGCSGWVYGCQTVGGLINSGCKRVLLCTGEGMQAYYSGDKSTYPLFGAAATCTAFEYDESAAPMEFHLACDGSEWHAIHIPHGGFRHPATAESFVPVANDQGIVSTPMHTHLNGMDVFMFGITQPPKSIKALCEHFDLNYADKDYLLLHQANLFLNEKIVKKLKIDSAKVPHNIEDFGNTSSSSVPLLMVSRLADELRRRPLDLIACAFGIGLSWGSVHFKTNKLTVSDIVLVEDSYAAE